MGNILEDSIQSEVSERTYENQYVWRVGFTLDYRVLGKGGA